MTRPPQTGAGGRLVGAPVVQYPVLPTEIYRRLGIPEPPMPGQAPPPPPGTLFVSGTRAPYVGHSIPTHIGGTPWSPGASGTPGGGLGAPGGGPGPDAATSVASGSVLPGGTTAGGWTPAPSARTVRRGPSTRSIVGVTTALVTLIIVVAAAIVATVQLHRGSEETDAVRATLIAENNAYNNRDFAAMIATHCATDVALLEARYTQDTFAASVDARVGAGGTWTVTVSNVSIDKQAGTATATETAVPHAGATADVVDPLGATDDVTLRKESGAWKICLVTTR